MNKSFLEYVAEDIVSKYGADLSRIVVVFPNKRASLFLNEYMTEMTDKPMWSPRYITISELFRQSSDLQVGDPLKLIGILHKVYQQCVGTDEPFEAFYGWGQLLLSDFDDIDKNMADAQKVFANITDLHELDDASYLNEKQRKILKQFFQHFTDDHTSLLKERFLRFWTHLHDIYQSFNHELLQQGIAYEGALCRKVIEDENAGFPELLYLFVGFNMLHKVEQKLFERLRDKARFYWDFDDYYMHGNEAGHFIGQYLQNFPNELDTADPLVYMNMRHEKSITILNAQTEDIQARYVSTWLSADNRIKKGRRTAIVLCDENLLPEVIHCLPDDTSSQGMAPSMYNITTGFPLVKSPIASLVSSLIGLQTVGRSGKRFRIRQVLQILRHPYAQYLSPECPLLLDELDRNRRYYLAPDDSLLMQFTDRNGTSELQQLFTLVEKNLFFTTGLLRWIASLLRTIGKNSVDEKDPLFKESTYRMYTLVNRMAQLTEDGDVRVETQMLQRLLGQLIQSTTIPFHGEPAVGVQIMGVLETRNLDFDSILVLSCNEGNMPKGIDDASFIPYSIRKAYDLTTIDHKVGIYAYYFYRLIQRANDITFVYNSSTEDGRRGEMSRFILQIMAEFPYPIRRLSLEAQQQSMQRSVSPIAKTPAVMEALRSLTKLSPTAVNRYLRCPLTFYYNVLADLKEPDEDDGETIDHRLFGTLFHRAGELAYLRLARPDQLGKDFRGHDKLIAPLTVQQESIDALLKNPATVEAIVDKAFEEELFLTANAPHSHPQLNGLQIINREVIISYLRQLLQIDRQLAPFIILGLERKVTLNLRDKSLPPIEGIIDRLDRISSGSQQMIRVIDYKTGRQPQQYPGSIEEVFDPQYVTSRHSDYYLQTLLYAYGIIQETGSQEAVAPALLFIQRSASEEYDPVLKFGKNNPIDNVMKYADEFMTRLHALLEEIYNPEVPFMPTPDVQRCQNCAYRQICGKRN